MLLIEVQHSKESFKIHYPKDINKFIHNNAHRSLINYTINKNLHLLWLFSKIDVLVWLLVKIKK